MWAWGGWGEALGCSSSAQKKKAEEQGGYQPGIGDVFGNIPKLIREKFEKGELPRLIFLTWHRRRVGEAPARTVLVHAAPSARPEAARPQPLPRSAPSAACAAARPAVASGF